MLEPENWGGGETTAERVKDSDALNGGAVRGKPNRPAGGMANTYSYPRIPGKYRATFRLKVADNTLDKPAFRIGVSDCVMHPLPGVPAIHNPSLEIKATDFKKPNVYQDFTVPFEHADMGFMGVGCNYLGNAEASWDRAVAELVEPWSDQRLAEHYKGMAPPAGLQFQRDDKLNVLVMRGLWNRLYRIDEALAPLGENAVVNSAYTTFHQQQDTQLSGFKLDWQPLFTQDVVVLANVETRGLGLGQVRMIGEFVRQGGGLVILGGLTTLGQAGNMQRGWAGIPAGRVERAVGDSPVRAAGAVCRASPGLAAGGRELGQAANSVLSPCSQSQEGCHDVAGRRPWRAVADGPDLWQGTCCRLHRHRVGQGGRWPGAVLGHRGMEGHHGEEHGVGGGQIAARRPGCGQR